MAHYHYDPYRNFEWSTSGRFREDFDDDSFDDDDENFFNDEEEIKERQERRSRRIDKISELTHMRKNMCGIGTNRVKRRLATKAKEGNNLAKALLLALKAEDANIQAKINYKYRGSQYSDYAYEEKEGYISDLIGVCNVAGYKYGCLSCFITDSLEVRCIVYCDLPDCRQLSWHSERSPDNYPRYDGEWDHAEDTTLAKIEEAILKSKIIPL